MNVCAQTSGTCPQHGEYAGGPCAECARAPFSCGRHGQRAEQGCLDCAAATTLNGLSGLPDVQARFSMQHALIMELREQARILEARIADLEAQLQRLEDRL